MLRKSYRSLSIKEPRIVRGLPSGYSLVIISPRGIIVSKRTNYKQEKRRKEVEKQKKKDAKKERKNLIEKVENDGNK